MKCPDWLGAGFINDKDADGDRYLSVWLLAGHCIELSMEWAAANNGWVWSDWLLYYTADGVRGLALNLNRLSFEVMYYWGKKT